MQSASFPARPTRSQYRHELRTLTYVTLDEGNGGVIRNLSHTGVSVQAVAALRAQQSIRLRFELRFPRLRVEARGQVSWSSPTGQCGIRFMDLSPRTRYQIDQWIFSNLLDTVAREAAYPRSMFPDSVASLVRPEHVPEEDGLTLSPMPRPAIRLEPGFGRRDKEPSTDPIHGAYTQLNWLSRPISPRTLAWIVDSMVVTAALLLFAVIFLSIAHELPQWPLTLAAGMAAAAFVTAAYWAVFAIFGGASLGVWLAEITSGSEQKDESGTGNRFR
jgi:PilZ domain